MPPASRSGVDAPRGQEERVLIAQITDIHVGFDRASQDDRNLQRLKAVVDRLSDGPNRPDMALLTGDLCEFGDAQSYALLAAALRDCPFPVWPMVGNHDAREPLIAAFPQTQLQGGFTMGLSSMPLKATACVSSCSIHLKKDCTAAHFVKRELRGWLLNWQIIPIRQL